MNAERIFELIWSVMNSPAVIAAFAAAVVWAMNKIYSKRPAWQAFEGTIIAAVKWAEREIPDDTPNKSLVRLNAALNYVLKVYEQARGPAGEQIKAELREGIQIVHAELEAAGNLDPPNQAGYFPLADEGD